MSAVAPTSDLLSREEAAGYLGVNPRTLANWSCTGRYALPVVKIGRLAKYRRRDLDRFIVARTVGAESPLPATA
jgi:predicted site-specific integrase-resolvase